MVRRRAFILGAGVSGLVTGWKLLEKGWDVDIMEKEPFYGGMARTWRWREFLLDVGPHIYHTPDAQLIEFWEREFGDLLIKGDFWCKNVKGDHFDRYYDYPLSRQSIQEYPEKLKQQILHDLKGINPEERTNARSYREYVAALVGPTLQQMFFEQYPKKLWGLSTEEMTSNWAPKRIEMREKSAPFYDGQWAAVGRYGTGCVYDRIYQKIVKLGGRVRLGQGVRALAHQDSLVTKLLLEGGEAIDVTERDVLVSTIPVNLLCRLLGIETALTFRGVTSVYLAFDRDYILPDGLHWLYYDHPELLFHRISEQKRFSADCAVGGKTCITAEIAYSKGDRIDRATSEYLVQTVLDQVCRTRLATQAEFIDGTVHKQQAVYPLQYKDYQHELARAQTGLGEFRQIYSIGTTGEFNYADSQILFLKAFDLAELLSDQHSELAKLKRMQNDVRLSSAIALNGAKVGDGQRPYIIAEAGLNHNGSIELALKLIELAAQVGCDAIKFQTYVGSSRVSQRVKKARYAETTIGEQETLPEMFRRLEFNKEEHQRLFDFAKQRGVEVFSTPFDAQSVDLLESLGVHFYKIASCDLVNIPLLRYVAATKKPMIVSTGMSTLGQIEEALEAIRSEGNPSVLLMHCVSAYPADPETMNLNVIRTLKSTFGVPVGLSDHTLGLMVAEMALALGANAVERHFTLDRTMEGPDHIFSSEPSEMRELVRCARLLGGILGDGKKKIEASEYDMINTQRRSLFACVDIETGQVISRDMIAIRGPGVGIEPRNLELILGRIARRRIEADYPITWECV